MRWARTLVALSHLVLWVTPAGAHTTDRVAAVAGSHVIFLSEVRTRARMAIDSSAEKDLLARAKLEAQAMHSACEEIIDDVLVADEAARIHLVVADDEVWRAIDSLAQNLGVDRPKLLGMVHDRGVTDADYREMFRSQLLLGKLLQLRHATDANVKEATAALHAELRARVYVEDRVAAPR